MPSMQTTIVAAMARAAETSWREHWRHCGPCFRRKRCKTGQDLWETMRETSGELTHQHQLDQAPAPGQSAFEF